MQINAISKAIWGHCVGALGEHQLCLWELNDGGESTGDETKSECLANAINVEMNNELGSCVKN